LTDGIAQAFSVDIDLRLNTTAKEEYYIFFTTNDLVLQPAEFSLNNNSGDAEIHATLTWAARSHGRVQVATVALYKKFDTGTNGPQPFISLNAMQNRYFVVCDDREFILSLVVKRLIKYCLDNP
jgi:hypothetical protein